MKIYDLVELINDRQEYSSIGVYSGMFGAIMSEEVIEGKRQVIFSEFHTGKDIADVYVREDDLTVHEFMPPERIPPK